MVSIDQIRSPNKSQKGEKLAILITYAFTINQVPHVFGEHYFTGQTQIHGIIHRKALSDADLRKGTRETPIKSMQLGQSTTGKPSWSSPWPTT